MVNNFRIFQIFLAILLPFNIGLCSHSKTTPEISLPFTVQTDLITGLEAMKSQDQNDNILQDSFSYAYIDENGSIWIKLVDEPEPFLVKQKRDNEGNFTQIKWSPDGSKLAYVQLIEKNIALGDPGILHVYDLPTRTEQQFNIDIVSFDWSPNSHEMIYSRSFEFTYSMTGSYTYQKADGIWLIDFETGQTSEIIPDSGAPLGFEGYSSSGRYILFREALGWDTNTPYFIYDNENPGQILETNKRGVCVWSPVEDVLACTEVDGINYPSDSDQIPCTTILIDPNGAEVDRLPVLTNDNCDLELSWAPDGNQLLIRTRRFWSPNNLGDVYDIYNFDTETRNQLEGNPTLGKWTPNSSWIQFIQWDSEKVEFVYPHRNIENGEEILWQWFTYWRPSGDVLGAQTGEQEEFSSDIYTPPAVTDLKVIPIFKSTNQDSNIEFSWIVPITSDQHNAPIKYFDLRFSHDPITEENWQDAVQIEGEIVAEDSGKNQVWKPTSFEVDTFTRNYFAIKGKTENGEWSPLSNISLLIDTGFRHNPDGYSFINKYSKDEMENLYQFTTDHLEKMFVRDEVCEPSYQSFCVPTMLGEQFIIQVNQSYLNGVCYGMASTSLDLFLNPETIYDQLGEYFFDIEFLGVYPSLTKDLKFVNSYIAYYQAISKTKAYEDEWTSQVQHNEPNDVFYRLRDYFLGVTDEPMILVFSVVQDGKEIAHAVTPIALSSENLSNGKWRLDFYDNKLFLKEDSRYFKFDILENKWESSGGIHTSDNSHMAMIPLSLIYQEKQELPYDLSDRIRIWLEQKLNIVITNEIGQRLGYLDDQFINEIPESIVVPEFGNTTGFVNPTIYLPSDSTYKFAITGKSLGEGSLYYNFDNYMINFSTNLPNLETEIELFLSPNEKSLSISSSEQIRTSLALTQIGAETRRINFSEVEVYPNTHINFEDAENGLSYNIGHTGSKDLAYTLNVEMRDSTGINNYILKKQVLRSGEIAQVITDDWKKKGDITLQIDNDGDGIFEKSILAEISSNEMNGDKSEVIQDQNNSQIGIVLMVVGILTVLLGGFGIFLYLRKRVA